MCFMEDSNNFISCSFNATKISIYFKIKMANKAMIRIIKNTPNDTTKFPRNTKNAKKNPKHSETPRIAPISTSMIMLTL